MDDSSRGNPDLTVSGRPLRWVRIGARELGADPELGRTVALLLEVLRRRQSDAGASVASPLPAVPSSGARELWIVEVEAAPGEARQTGLVPSDRWVAHAIELMQLQPRRRWSVQSLAKAVGLSRAAFARRFAAATGTTPIAHLAELRLALAAQRLAEGDARLAEVALEVGYESEFAFSRAFKRRYGVPPVAFRRQRQSPTAPRCMALAA
jgi:AraC-like DNA-binding protein